MAGETNETSAARLLVAALEANGVERVFLVPGESYLAVIDALSDSPIATVPARQESGAAFMAEASAKLTGKAGVCMVTRAPGAMNASAGLHVAEHDSTPLILFVGQIERSFRERGAFQEMDFRRVFGSFCKWVAEVDSADRMVEMVNRAFAVATSGRPGPVVLVLPEDMLTDVAPAPVEIRPAQTVETHPGAAQMWDLQKRLWAAKRPLAILGGSRWSEKAVRQFARFAEKFDLPVACSFRRQMLYDHADPHYAGDVGLGINPALADRIRAADLILMVGGRFAEVPSQSYALIDLPFPKQSLVHVHADAEELGRVYRADLAIHATGAAFAAAAEGLEPPPAGVAWGEWRAAARTDYLAWSEEIAENPGAVQMAAIYAHMRKVLPPETIMTTGAGNFSIWLHRFWRFRQWATQASPVSGSMGYGLPAGIGAKLTFPERPVVVLTGDGDFQMTSQEFATACQAGAAVVVLLFDNGIWGTIRMHQEREFPGRVHATKLVNPDFAAVARAHGAFAATVKTSEAFAPAFDAALTSGGPALLHILIDPEAITPRTTLTKIREAAAKGK